jgi:A/G-specific adenine glycosylase
MLPPFEYTDLLNWHALRGRHHLPWRQINHLSVADRTYRIWLSEILLQQTQADRVVGFYTRILERYPTIWDLAQASYEEFFPFYQGLGYYSRARNLLKTAQIVTQEFDGVLPSDSSALIQLPGVGPYTAEAIRAFAYDLPTLSFDTNLDKIFARYYHGTRHTKLSKIEKSEILADFVTQSAQTSELRLSGRAINAALMDLGALWSYNSPALVNYSESPFQYCKFTETQGTLEITPLKTKTYFPLPDAQIFVVIHCNHQEYYSLSEDEFSPFSLAPMSQNEPASKNDPRHTIQSHFREQYRLELSVRPPRVRGYIQDIPYILVYAQIQSGEHTFVKHSKQALREWLKKI